MDRKQRTMGAVTVVIAAVAAQLLSALQALGGDDIYVLANLRAATWSRRLFAFNLDTPAPGYMPWWTGMGLQRRFIRVPASALLWLESKLFGFRSVPYHLVTIALLACSCLLLFILLSKRVPVAAAAAAAVLPAIHPAASEIVADLCCQPIATAGLFSIASVDAWWRMRERPSAGALGLVVLLCALAVTSYEAAVVLPVFLVLTDLSFGVVDGSKARRWGPRLAMLCIVAVYVPWAISIRGGLVAPDTTPVRPLGEVLLALRLDSIAYLCKALGLFDPTDPTTYWLQQRVGEASAAAITLGLLVGAVWLVHGSKLGTVGLVGFAFFLAPPLLTRATVSVVNMPALRQLYLPVLMGAAPLVAALAGAALRLRVALPLMTWAAAFAVESEIAGGTLDINNDRRRVTEATERILAGVPGDSTVVAVGTYLCGFAPSLIWPGPTLLGIPSRSEDDPLLVALDDHTLIAQSTVGFDVRTKASAPRREPGAGRGPMWSAAQPVELAVQGSQRIAGARVSIESREGDRITALRYAFDRPLSEVAFIRFRGCTEPEKFTPSCGDRCAGPVRARAKP